jgi:SAM-dependent methyltransferase
MNPAQETLSEEQLKAFYHEDFVEEQTRDFIALAGAQGGSVLDIGGGCGFFARRLQANSAHRVKVLDTDHNSIAACHAAGVEAVQGDALDPPPGDADVVSFNLVLHHLVGASERATRGLQRKALQVWQGRARRVFVNEYIYESFIANFSGWLIYRITSSRVLSAIGRAVAKIVPSFKANTFGVGVRFRAHDEWRALFAAAGYEVTSSLQGVPEHVSPPLRLLLIRQIRRDSFMLTPKRS